MNPEDVFKSLIEYVRIKRNIKLIILVILLNLLGLIMSVLGYKLLTAFLGIIVLGLLSVLLYQELDRLHTLISKLREAEHQN